MALTNKTIDVYSRSTDRHGVVTRTLVGSYDVWWEPSEQVRWKPGEYVVGKGIVFIWTDLTDYNNLSLKIDGEFFDVVGVSRYFDDVGDFVHAELTYR